MASTFKMAILLLMLGRFVPYAAATDSLGNIRTTNHPLLKLEQSVWKSDSSSFSSVENLVVRTIQEDSHSVFGHYLLSVLYLRIYGDNPADLTLLKKAADLAQQAIELDPKQPYGYVALGDILDALGQTEKATTILENYRQSASSRNWRIEFTLARLKTGNDSKRTVFSLYENSLEIAGKQKEIVAPFVIAMLQSQYSGDVLVKKLQLWQNRFPSTTFLRSLAIAQVRSKNYQAANKIYSAMHNEAFAGEAIINQAIILYTYLNKKDRALKLLTGFEPQPHHFLTAASQSLRHEYLGYMLLESGEISASHRHFIIAAEKTASPLQLLSKITDHYRKQKQFNALILLYKSLQTLIPGNGTLFALTGEVLSEDLSSHADAIKAYSNAISLEPDRSDFYNGLGLAYYRMNSIEQALEVFTSAYEINPNDAVAKYNEACALALLGKSQAALSSLSKALSIQPRLISTALNDSDLRSLHHSELFKQLVYSNQNDNINIDLNSSH